MTFIPPELFDSHFSEWMLMDGWNARKEQVLLTVGPTVRWWRWQRPARNDGQTAMLGLFETVECISTHSTAVSGDGSRTDCEKLVYRNSLPSLNE